MKNINIFNYYLLFSLLLISFASCENTVSPSKYVQFISDAENGLKKEINTEAYNMVLQYKPTSFIIANELRKENISSQEHNNREKELDHLIYFNLQIAVNEPGKDITNFGIQNATQQQERLYYLNFGMQNDIRLAQGRDTLAPVAYHFERSYGISKYKTFVLAFNKTDQSLDLDKTLLVYSEVLGIEPTAITISKNDLNKIPKIKVL